MTLAMLILPVLFLLTPVDDPSESAGESLAEIVGKVRTALGYDQLVAANKPIMLRALSRDYAGNETEVELTFTPDGRFHQHYKSVDQGMSGYDGETPWQVLWGSGMELTLAERESVLTGMWLRTGFWLDARAPLELKLDADDSTAGGESEEDTSVILMKLKDGRYAWAIRIDRKTWLPISAKSIRLGRKTEIRFEDYQLYEGWNVPRRLKVSVNGRVIRESTTESLTCPQDFSEDIYAPRLGTPDDSRFDPSVGAALKVKRSPLADRLLVHPLINGKDVGWFLLDSGAAGWGISSESAEQAGLEIFGRAPTTGSAGITIEMAKCRARTIRLGPLEMKDQIMRATHTLNTVGEYVGIIGFGLFARCVMEYDAIAGTISIFDPERYELEGGFWREIIPGQIVPTMEASFEGHTGLFRLDTGMSSHVVFHTHCVRRHGMLEDRETHTIGAVGGDGALQIERGMIEWIEFADKRFTSVPAEFSTLEAGILADPFTEGIIGNELLKAFKLVIDYPNSRIAFIPRD